MSRTNDKTYFFTDSTTWTVTSLGKYVNSLITVGNRFVASTPAANGSVVYSTDGKTWTSYSSSGLPMYGQVWSLEYGANALVVCAVEIDNYGVYITKMSNVVPVKQPGTILPLNQTVKYSVSDNKIYLNIPNKSFIK